MGFLDGFLKNNQDNNQEDQFDVEEPCSDDKESEKDIEIRDLFTNETKEEYREYKVKEDLQLVQAVSTEEEYEYPPIEILNCNNIEHKTTKMDMGKMAIELQKFFNSFNISVKVVNIVVGPSIITYEIELATGVSVGQIKNLKDDISLNLGTKIVKIGQVPNKPLLGIEIERKDKGIVSLGEIINTEEFQSTDSKVLIGLGQETNGRNKIIDLEKTSHMLISGTTGSGKSVCIHSIVNSILYKAKPSEVNFLLIDTKVVELSKYNGIPHLVIPVITDSVKATGALQWAIYVMEKRYNLLVEKSVKNLKEYNLIAENDEKLPQIVIIIDEFADLIEYDKKEIEDLIYRLTQRAEKVGIYIIISTERPSTNIITGTIKANIPTRIALRTASQVDSRVILDVSGAEDLLGDGDMLYYSIGCLRPVRIQGSFISEEQIEEIVHFLKQNS